MIIDPQGCILSFTGIRLLGRKRTLVLMFLGTAVFFLVAIPDIPLSGEWDLSRIACLFSVTFTGAAFGTIYLFTGELSPTSHRGMIFCFCSGSARIGSFLGSYVSLLYDVLDRRVVLAMFASAGFLAAGAIMLVPDSTGKPIPDTPADTVRQGKKLRE